VTIPLERAAGGDTPVLSFRVVAVASGAADPGPVRLLLDTGASATMITPGLAARLGLVTVPLPAGSLALEGGGEGCGALAPRRALLPDLRLAAAGGPAEPPGDGLLLQGVEALVLPVAALPAGVEGVLGAPSLRLLPVLIEPEASRLVLGAPAPAAFRSASGHRQPPLRVPLLWRQGVPLFRLDAPAGSVLALADTGAEGLFLSRALAARLQPLAAARPLRLVGVCGEQRVEMRPFRGLRLPLPPQAAEAGAAVEGIVTDNPVFRALGIEAIVGQEWLRRRSQLWRLDQDPPLLLLR